MEKLDKTEKGMEHKIIKFCLFLDYLTLLSLAAKDRQRLPTQLRTTNSDEINITL